MVDIPRAIRVCKPKVGVIEINIPHAAPFAILSGVSFRDNSSFSPALSDFNRIKLYP
jgi:hypothetical protein